MKTKMIDWRLASALALAGCSQAPEERNVPVVEDVAVNVTAATPQGPREEARHSVFTKLDDNCRLLEENREEGPYWLRRCPGQGGWQVNWSESDLRQGLTLIGRDGKEADLDLSSLVAKGAFNTLGSTVEWRGPAVGTPDVLIARMDVASGAEPSRPDISRLAVVRLAPAPCLIAVVEPSSDQNAKAREIADRKLPACVES